ncbi:hypothetical protein BVX97_03020 [bacterium E08(2017)]|nr:hypothetical protein BVX97_03020 [bacterium E08(2017)]
MADFLDTDTPDPWDKTVLFKEYIDDLKSKGHYSYHRRITSACGSRVAISDEGSDESRRMIVMTSNNYLGLNTRQEVIEAGINAIRKYGSGMCGSRFLSGTYDLIEDLEAKIAKFEHTEAAQVFTSGYQANVGTIASLMRSNDVVFIDRLCHASIIDGCRLGDCEYRTFRHNDVDSLEAALKRYGSKFKGRMIVVDGIFSMDGDMAPLDKICDLAQKYDAKVMVDEAHSTGVVGETGRGTVEHFGVADKVDIILGTFSKTLSGTGGFIAASEEIVNYVRHYGRSYMFSASPTPSVIASVTAALDIVEKEPELKSRLWDNIRFMHQHLKAIGYEVYPDPPQSAVITVVIGPDAKAHAMSKDIYDNGVFSGLVVYPSVSRNEAKIRLSITALHSKSELTRVLEVLELVGKQYGLI